MVVWFGGWVVGFETENLKTPPKNTKKIWDMDAPIREGKQ